MIPKTKGAVIELLLGPAYDDTDFKTAETVAYNAAGIAVSLFQETANGVTVTAITPSNTDDSTHNYWAHQAKGVHALRITAAQNNAACVMWAVAVATGVLQFESPRYIVTTANVNDALLGSDKFDVNTAEVGGQTASAAAGVTFPATISSLAAGAQMDLVNAPNGTALAAVKSALANLDVSLKQILGTTLTETGAGYLAAAFKKFLDVATPLLVASEAMRGTDNAATAASVAPLLASQVLVSTTIATVGRSTTGARLTAGSDDDNAYVGMWAVMENHSGEGQYTARAITAYSGSTKQLTWTPAISEDAGDGRPIYIIPGNSQVAPLIATAQADLDILTGADGAILDATEAEKRLVQALKAKYGVRGNLYFFSTVSGNDGCSVTASSAVAGTVIGPAESFQAGMVGKSMTIADVGTVTITGFTDDTTVTTDGGGTFSDKLCTVTANSGLLPSDLLAYPHKFTGTGPTYADATVADYDGAGFCILDVVDETYHIRLKGGHVLFGFGPKASVLKSSSDSCKMGTALDIYDVTWQVAPDTDGDHGILEVNGNGRNLIADLSIEGSASRVCPFSSLGVGSARNVTLRNVELLGEEFAIRIQENILYDDLQYEFIDCYIHAWTPVMASTSKGWLTFINCDIKHRDNSTSTGTDPIGLWAPWGDSTYEQADGHITLRGCRVHVAPTASDTGAIGVSSKSAGTAVPANVTIIDTDIFTRATGTGAAYDCLCDSIDDFQVFGGQVDMTKCDAQVYFMGPLEDIINDTADMQPKVSTLSTCIAGITSLPAWLRGLFRKDAMNATAKSEVNTGGGAFNEATDSLEGIRDTQPLGTAMRGTDDANTTTPPTVEQIRTEMEKAGTKLTSVKTLTDTLTTMITAGAFTEAALANIPAASVELTDEQVEAIATDVAAALTIPTAVQNAVALLDRLLATHTTAGSVGAALTAILAKALKIGSVSMQVTSPVVSNQEVQIYRTGSYDSDDGLALTFVFTDYSGPAIDGATFRAVNKADFDAGTVEAELSKAGTVSTSGSTVTVTVELSSTDTDLDATPPLDDYAWHFTLFGTTTTGDREVVLADGAMDVRQTVQAGS
jgi:hypothetical protein